MALKPFEIVEFGGVDSRSNPVNMPRNRALRCLNWVPKQDGHLELRYGYSTESMSSVTVTAIHSMFPYQNWDATKKYILVGQGTVVRVHDLSTNTESAPTVRGAAIASSSKWGSYFANNRLHFGNGTDQKFFDGTTIRDNGLRAPTTVEVQSVTIVDGVRELTSTENSTITLTPAGGGGSPATTIGQLYFVAIFDTSNNELGPATVVAGAGTRVNVTLNQKVTVGNLPNLSSVNANWIKLIAGTLDGGAVGYFFYSTSPVFVGTIARSSNVVTITTTTPHGRSPGDIIVVNQVLDDTYNGVFKLVTAAGSTLTYNQVGADGSSSGGKVQVPVFAANAATSVDVLNTSQLVGPTPVANAATRGLAASSVGGANPGYQFYACIYNPLTGHVGNRIAIAGRYLPGKSFSSLPGRSTFHVQGLPDYSGTDSEWVVLLGRTGDGAAVPYVIEDASGNFIYAKSGATSIVVVDEQTDGNFELPTRNGIIPAQCTMFAHVGDYIYAADPSSPTIRRSGSQQDSNQGMFLGRPEQSWAANDIDTFPTAEAVKGIAEEDQELFVGTLNDCAVLTDQNGIPMWKGPWNVGLAGPRAMVKAKPYGFFWLSSSKQLCTFVNGMPTPVSEEYEASELSQIGDAYLLSVELTYYRDASIGKDELRIEGQKQDGTPISIIHDFKLRDERSPFGQGYSAQFSGPLGTAFASVMARDANGKRSVYTGASTGQLYKLYSGADDVGQQYTADGISLIDVGPNRPSIPWIAWVGDENVQLFIGKTLATSLDLTAQDQFALLSPTTGLPQNMPGAEDDPIWRVDLDTPQMQTHLYIRLMLASHSADGNLSFNSPPHVPLETYGRIYEIIPAAEAERGR